MKRKNISLLLLVAILLLGTLSACGGGRQTGGNATPAAPAASDAPEAQSSQQAPAQPSQSAESIKIGYVGSITGEGAMMGEYELKGIRMAVDEINSAGGINGVPLEIIEEDAAGTNSGAVLATQKITRRDDVVAIIGLVRSPFIMAASEYIQEAKIPTITGASALQVTRHGNPYIFRDRAHDGDVTGVAVKFAVENLKAEKIAILHDTDVFGTGGYDNLKINMEKYGIEPVIAQGYQTGTKDWTPQLLNIKQSGADVIIGWGSNSQENAVILRQIKQMGLDVKFIGSPAYGTTVLLDAAGEYAEGLYAINDWSVSLQNEKSLNWVEAFNERYGHDPDWAAVSAYDGLYILANAIKVAGPDREAIADAIRATSDLEGIQGMYNFNGSGDGNHQMVISQVVDGKFVVVDRITVDIEG